MIQRFDIGDWSTRSSTKTKSSTATMPKCSLLKDQT